MGKKKTKAMNLNRETAMRLWNERYGKLTKVKDFTGREIVKGAYNDRTSKFAWNVDHVLPQSRGGKTADYNLVICHMRTNDEKADSFPCFNANGLKFKIIKVQNHYEIRPLDEKPKEAEEDELNLYDSASGIRFFKKLKGTQNKERFTGTITIKLGDIKNTAVIDFIEEIFYDGNLSYSKDNNYFQNTVISFKYFNLPYKEQISELLDKCILLNTYLRYYFCSLGYISDYQINFEVDYFENKKDMYKGKIIHGMGFVFVSPLKNSLFINNLVYINTEAKDNEQDLQFNGRETLKEYDYINTNLKKNLEKEVNKE